jgi:glucose-1-phosphatase
VAKTIFFDLGNVLLFFSHDKMCSQIAKFCKLDEDHVKQVLFSEGLGEQYERGVINSRDVHGHFCSLAKKQLEFLGFMRAASDIFQPNEEIVPIIKELKRNNVRLIVLSNTCEAHFDFAYLHYPLLHLFDDYVLSYKVQARKPEKKIFSDALDIAGVPKEDCFYTDDISEYVQAASACGIDAETFTTADKLAQQLTLRNYLQIKE